MMESKDAEDTEDAEAEVGGLEEVKSCNFLFQVKFNNDNDNNNNNNNNDNDNDNDNDNNNNNNNNNKMLKP